MSEEWKVVTKLDKKRVIKTGSGKRQNEVTASSLAHHVVDSIENAETLLKLIGECKQKLASTMVWEEVLRKYDTLEEVRLCQTLVCYGIGNFSKTTLRNPSASLWQLAFSIKLKDLLSQDHKVTMIYYDPCTTNFESDFLANSLGITLVAENEKGRRSIDNVPTIFFMPHCPRSLYENVVWANWTQLTQQQQHTPLFIIGNSLLEICESLLKTNRQCITALSSFMHQTCLCTSSCHKHLSFGNNFGRAFSDTYLTWWDEPSIIESGQLQFRPYETLDSHNSVNDIELI